MDQNLPRTISVIENTDRATLRGAFLEVISVGNLKILWGEKRREGRKEGRQRKPLGGLEA